jgi:CRISPR-associated protein Cmr2
MSDIIYTVITFAPVQGFIEKSRKLRDLYGSSFLLSYLSWVICKTAEKLDCPVISPALIDVAQGTPNQIIVQGDFKESDAQAALDIAWESVVETCREWIEEEIGVDRQVNNGWSRSWKLWHSHSWEFFWVQGKPGESISDVREHLNNKKYARGWTGINWQGESSSLSGADAIAYPGLGRSHDPRLYSYQREKQEITDFYQKLQNHFGESFIDTTEELSVPELIKRMVTHYVIAKKITVKLRAKIQRFLMDFTSTDLDKLDAQVKKLSTELNPRTFKDLNRHTEGESFWTGWFQGDGDRAGDYLRKYPDPDSINEFSTTMRKWGQSFQQNPPEFCRVVYAGGDDFLGIFYDSKELPANHCVRELSNFKSNIWDQPKRKPISASVGFVWAAPGIPQRDVLQHCRLAEKSAKTKGRDRIAFRILFNNGNHLEWVCPWHLLEKGLLTSYSDRDDGSNWTHIYNDVAVLEARHAFTNNSQEIALALFEIYFSTSLGALDSEQLWNRYQNGELIHTGVLGDETLDLSPAEVNQAINDWIINLAKVGFHLCQE